MQPSQKTDGLAPGIVSSMAASHIAPVQSDSNIFCRFSKAQAISGHVLSFFLVHALLSSLDDLAENSNQDPEKLLAELQNEEYHQNQDFLHAELPEYIYRQYPGYVAKGKGVPEAYYLEPKPEVPIEIMNLTFQGPSLCHTARLPSRTRYLGYLFNNGKVGDVAPYGNETYETGIFKDEADKTEAYGEMRLAYTIYKERQAGCNSVLAPDYGDYFYAHQKDDWAKLAFPNDAEKAAYRYHQSNYRGLLAVSFKGCAWGKCPDGQIQQGGFDEGQFEMKVNGKKVVKIFKFSGDVSFLLHKDGLYFTPSSNDDYEISIRVKKPGGYLKISSFILY